MKSDYVNKVTLIIVANVLLLYVAFKSLRQGKSNGIISTVRLTLHLYIQLKQV